MSRDEKEILNDLLEIFSQNESAMLKTLDELKEKEYSRKELENKE